MSDTYLAHFGIKGQKHGIRRAEWYPIAAYQAHLKNAGYSDKDIKNATKRIGQVEKLESKSQKYKSKVPNHYISDIGKAKAQKYVRKANAAEGKAYKISKKIPEVAREERENNDSVNEALANDDLKRSAADFNGEKVQTSTEAKKTAIDKGDLNYVKTHYSEFTTNEINDVINRHAALNKVNSITEAEANKGKKKVESIQRSLGTAQDISSKVANTASNAFRLYSTVNAFTKTVNSQNNQNNQNKKK